jgi:galactokinase
VLFASFSEVSLADDFTAATGHRPDGVWRAPGRVNVIGEHTDYNDGFVLPIAIREGVTVAAAAGRPDRTLTAASRQRPAETVTIDLDHLHPGHINGWGVYVAGVAWALQESGCGLTGGELLIDSDLPAGAGLSSSAALECAMAVALDALAGLSLSTLELARIAHKAENEFVGVPCGVMDQMASMTALAGHAICLDTRSLQAEPVPFSPARAGLTLLIINTNAPHALVDSEYAERRRACERAARLLGVASLRDLSERDLDEALGRLHDPVLIRRVRHVVTENGRVLATVSRLRGPTEPAGGLASIGPLLTASHRSLRDDYEVSSARLDSAVEAALEVGALGARLTGAGFGGCAIALAPADSVPNIVASVDAAFCRRGFAAPTYFLAEPSTGAHRIS